MITLQRNLLTLGLRNDLATFIHRTFQTIAPGQQFLMNWHIQALAWHLEQCAKGNIKRLLITLPPRHLKSISASVAFPAWAMGCDPTKRIICASYSAELANKHARDCRSVMDSSWFRQAFAETVLSREKNAEMDFMTTRGGYRYSTSTGGTLTGRGGNLIIIDDPIKAEDALSEARRTAVNEWFSSTAYSRLDSKRDDVIILIMQRLHLDDLAGYVMKSEPWVHLNLPAIAEVEERIQIGATEYHLRRVGDVLHEARENRADLDEIKARMGSFNFSAQFQQRPIPLKGEIVRWEWFQFYDQVPPRGPRDQVVLSVDTASKEGEINDYSVCTSWLVKGNERYLLGLARDRVNYPDLKRLVIDQAVRFRVSTIIIEDAGSGTALSQELAREGYSGVPKPSAIRPDGSKVTRMSTASAQIESRQVFLPRSADFLEDLRLELLQFPYGRHDDQADSISQFLNWIGQRNRHRTIIRGW